MSNRFPHWGEDLVERLREQVRFHLAWASKVVDFHEPSQLLCHAIGMGEIVLEDSARELTKYFNALAGMAQQGLLIPEARDLVLVALGAPELTLEQEQELTKRFEAALFSEEVLSDQDQSELDEKSRRDLEWIVKDGFLARDHLLDAFDYLAIAHALSSLDGTESLRGAVFRARRELAEAFRTFDYTKQIPCGDYLAWVISGRPEHNTEVTRFGESNS